MVQVKTLSTLSRRLISSNVASSYIFLCLLRMSASVNPFLVKNSVYALYVCLVSIVTQRHLRKQKRFQPCRKNYSVWQGRSIVCRLITITFRTTVKYKVHLALRNSYKSFDYSVRIFNLYLVAHTCCLLPN